MGAFVYKEPELHAQNMQQLVDWYFAGKIKPYIEGIFPLSRAAEVLQRLHNRSGSGKLILKP
jgi:NADPH2:quinone reductase